MPCRLRAAPRGDSGGQRSGIAAAAAGSGRPWRRPATARPRLRPGRGIDQQRGDAAPCAARRAASSASASARGAAAACRRGRYWRGHRSAAPAAGCWPSRRTASASASGCVEPRGERRAAAARQPARLRLARTSEVVGGSSSSAPRAAEGDHRHLVAPHIAIGQQQLDRALRLGQPVQRGGAGGIDDEDRRRGGLLAEAADADVVLPHAMRRALRRLARGAAPARAPRRAASRSARAARRRAAAPARVPIGRPRLRRQRAARRPCPALRCAGVRPRASRSASSRPAGKRGLRRPPAACPAAACGSGCGGIRLGLGRLPSSGRRLGRRSGRLLRLLARRQPGWRAGRAPAGRRARILLAHLVAPGQRRGGAGSAQGQERRAQGRRCRAPGACRTERLAAASSRPVHAAAAAAARPPRHRRRAPPRAGQMRSDRAGRPAGRAAPRAAAPPRRCPRPARPRRSRAAERRPRPSRSQATSPLIQHGGEAGGGRRRPAARPWRATTTPPSASASRPRSATGRPALQAWRRGRARRAAGRPARRAASGARGRPAAAAPRSSASQASRTGPGSGAQHGAAEAGGIDRQERGGHGGITARDGLSGPSAITRRTIPAMRAFDPGGGDGLVQRIAPQPVPQRGRGDPPQMRASSTSASPSSAARARAARISVSSPRSPSVPSAMQSRAARSSAASGTCDARQPAPGGEDAGRATPPRPPAQCGGEAGGVALEGVAPLAPPRCGSARSSGVRTSTERPKRSSSCGRSSPSSGLPLPTSTKRAGWRMLSPSRSTTFSPEAATSSSRSTRWSSSRFDLVDVEKAAMGAGQQAGLESLHAHRPARARYRARRRPGPRSRRAAGRPPARGTRGCGGTFGLAAAAVLAQCPVVGGVAAVGGSRRPPASAAAARPARGRRWTCRCRGRRTPARRRCAGSTAAIRRACFISSCPTMAEKGKTRRTDAAAPGSARLGRPRTDAPSATAAPPSRPRPSRRPLQAELRPDRR